MKLHFSIIVLSLSGALATVDTNSNNDNSKSEYMQDLLTPVRKASNNIRGTKDGRRLQDEICLPEYKYTTKEGCTTSGLVDAFDDLKEALSVFGCTHDAMRELELVLDVEGEEAVRDFFRNECVEFWSSQEGRNFAEIGDGTDLFIKEFFDGGTYWNEARETTNINGEVVNVLSVDPGEKIVGIHNTDAVSGLIDLPEQITNFESCKARVAMCCWVSDRQADDDGDCAAETYDENCVDAEPSDNTDVCAVKLGRARDSNNVKSGFTLFPGGREGKTHCHGFAWTDDEIDTSNIFKGNNLFHISAFDHLVTRGYVKNVPGAPMCGCVENMPIVSRADCTEMELVQDTTIAFTATDGVTVTPSGEWKVEFNACKGRDGNDNDLGAYVERLRDEDRITARDLRILRKNVVGRRNCPAVIQTFIDDLIAAEEEADEEEDLP